MDHLISPDGRRVQDGSAVESQFAAVLQDWWQHSRQALAGLELWHHAAQGRPRRGLAPEECDIEDVHSIRMPEVDGDPPVIQLHRRDRGLFVELDESTPVGA